MDPTRFDALARAFAAEGTRRRLLTLLAALPLGGVLALDADDTEAERPHDRVHRRTKQRKRKRRNQRRRKHHNNKKHKHKGGKGGVGSPQDCSGIDDLLCPDGHCCHNGPGSCCGSGCCPDGTYQCCGPGTGPASGCCPDTQIFCCAPGTGGPAGCCQETCCPPGQGPGPDAGYAEGCCTASSICAPRTRLYGGCCPLLDGNHGLCEGAKGECCDHGPNTIQRCCNDGSCCEDLCCGDTCCDPDQVCLGSTCCTPDCTDKSCVDDGCGGICPCPSGQACEGSTCVCNATGCPTGCCDGNTCVTENQQGDTRCGTGGVACAECTNAQICGEVASGGSACCTPPGFVGPCTAQNYLEVCCLLPGEEVGCDVATGTCTSTQT